MIEQQTSNEERSSVVVSSDLLRAMNEERSSVVVPRDLLRAMALRLAEHAKIWGADEDTSRALEYFQDVMDQAGESDLVESIARDVGGSGRLLPATDIAGSSHVIIQKQFCVPLKKARKLGTVPPYKVLGPIRSHYVVCEEPKEGSSVQGKPAACIILKVMAEIDHDAYELMIEEGLLSDPENPFELKITDRDWTTDIISSETIKLI